MENNAFGGRLPSGSRVKVVLQKLAEGTQEPGGSHFLLGLGRYSKQAGNEGDLPADVAFGHALHLPLADHMHALIALQRSPSRFIEKKPIPGLTTRLMKRWSCSIRLLRYLTCLSSTCSGRIPAALSSAMALG